MRGDVSRPIRIPLHLHLSDLLSSAILLIPKAKRRLRAVPHHPGLRRLFPTPVPEGHAVDARPQTVLMPAGLFQSPAPFNPPEHYQELHTGGTGI